MELQAKIDNLKEHLQKLEAEEQVGLSMPCITAFLGASSSHVCTATSVCPSSWLCTCCLCSEVLTARGGIVAVSHSWAGWHQR